jgi:hypothetical protein
MVVGEQRPDLHVASRGTSVVTCVPIPGAVSTWSMPPIA